MQLLHFPILAALLLGVSVSASAQNGFDRVDDGLLENPALQRVVDLQNARNASALTGMLADADARIRARAAFALASVQDSSATEPLARLLTDDAASVRADVAFALGQTGRPGGDVLPERLALEEDAVVLHELLQAIGKVGVEDDLDRLLAADLPDGLEWSRSLAMTRFGLRGIITDAAIGRQIDLLESASPDIRRHAGYYFWRIRTPDAWRPRRDAVRGALARLDAADPAAGYLALALASLEDRRDVERLRELAASSDWRVRVRVMRALGAFLSDSTARSALMEALSDPMHHVAISAATSLGAVQDLSPQEVRQFAGEVSYEDVVEATIAGHLLSALAKTGHTETVIQAVAQGSDQPAAVRAALLPPLSHLDDDASRRLLMASMRSDHQEIAFAATTALAARWRRVRAQDVSVSEYLEPFSAAVRSGDVALIYAAAPLMTDSLFVRRGSIDVLSGTLATLEPPRDTEAMLAIIDALGSIPGSAARDALSAAAEHPHDVVRQAARRQLGTSEDRGQASEIRRIDWQYLESLGSRPHVVMETELGTITLELNTEQAPQTVETITRLAREGRYDGVPFHRVVPDFVIQGGDFARGDGFGGPGFEIRSEFTRILYERGVAGMASAGKDTEGSQFFVTHSMQPHLDGSYTAFGSVIDGMDVVDAVGPGTRVTRVYVAD